MKRKVVINQSTDFNESKVTKILNDYESKGTLIGDGSRNVIKIIDFKNVKINVKGFRVPNLINKIVYRFFRKSKAQRSFEYAHKLSHLSINTPNPIAYVEYTNVLFFGKSFYLSEQVTYDLTFHDLLINKDLFNYTEIIKKFAEFTYQLHEKDILFLDHSPGNTLITINEDDYKFSLVDLNRMKFKSLTFDERMKNFARLSPRDHMLDLMSETYAKLYTSKTEDEIKEKMYYYSHRFMNSFAKRENFKKKYYFWRKKKH